jgi:cell division protein FtsI/penicillin-binding protein 2
MDDHPEYRRGQTIGRRGIERRWERELRGADGKENVAVDAKGRHLGKEMDELLIPESERRVDAMPGNNLVLSLDERLQDAADKAFPGRAGAVVVMEAKTGFVLAMLSRPSYDPNKMSLRITREELRKINEDPLKPMLFRVMNENYHPGSTFKMATSLAAAAATRWEITAGGATSRPATARSRSRRPCRSLATPSITRPATERGSTPSATWPTGSGTGSPPASTWAGRTAASSRTPRPSIP